MKYKCFICDNDCEDEDGFCSKRCEDEFHRRLKKDIAKLKAGIPAGGCKVDVVIRNVMIKSLRV